jgi:hypothetical protein
MATHRVVARRLQNALSAGTADLRDARRRHLIGLPGFLLPPRSPLRKLVAPTQIQKRTAPRSARLWRPSQLQVEPAKAKAQADRSDRSNMVRNSCWASRRAPIWEKFRGCDRLISSSLLPAFFAPCERSTLPKERAILRHRVFRPDLRHGPHHLVHAEDVEFSAHNSKANHPALSLLIRQAWDGPCWFVAAGSDEQRNA